MVIDLPPRGQGRPSHVEGANGSLPLGSGVPPGAPGAECWAGRHMRLSEEDRCEFLLESCARYLVRERTLRDFRLHPTRHAEMRAIRRAGERRLPPMRRAEEPGARSLVVVFRSGHQLPVDEPPGFLVLARAIHMAEMKWKRCPALGADAVPDISPNLWLSLPGDEYEQPAPVVSEFVYVDAPGDFSIGVYGVRLYKTFDPDDVSLVDRYTLAALQALMDRQRGFDRTRLRGHTGPLLYPLKLLLSRRRRRR